MFEGSDSVLNHPCHKFSTGITEYFSLEKCSLDPNLNPNAQSGLMWHYLYSMICCLIITGVLMDCY